MLKHRQFSSSTMEAASPFAPTGRNRFFHLLPQNPSPIRRVSRLVVLFLLIRWQRSKAGKSARRFLKTILQSAAKAIVDYCTDTLGVLHINDSFHKVDTDQNLIRSVLMYWFGQHSPDVSQKKLWMIASSSEAHRIQIDGDIADKFERIIHDHLYTSWCAERFGYQGKLATIIVLDQFSRHIHRHVGSTQNNGGSKRAIPSQSSLDKLAYDAARRFTMEHQQEMECGMISLPMIVFALMPYRHASNLHSMEIVQDQVEKLQTLEEQFDAMLRRFRKATNRRMAVLQGEDRRTGGEEMQNRNHEDIDILETFAFKANMDPARQHIVHKTIVDFLGERGVLRNVSAQIPVIVSLSGGVDSMVIASVLAHLVQDCNFDLKVYAVHIDYANRPESGAEADFVKRYCEERGITFCLRRIVEATRGVTSRDDYERISREARYQCYRDTVAGCKEDCGDSHDRVGVMLGHHRGDLRENVLSNSHKGSGPLDLSGMTAVSVNDRVVIYRPLLPLEKKEVLDYAHKFGVPYFKDTTPNWSTRGKLRNRLLPLLQEIYGEGCMNNLSNLATESDQARILLHDAVLGPFLDKVERHPMGITFDTAAWRNQGLFFWKFVLRETLHNASLGMFSDKSVGSFLNRIQADKLKAGWLQCRKDYAVYLRGDGKVFVLFPDSFPFRKTEQFDCIGTCKCPIVGFLHPSSMVSHP